MKKTITERYYTNCPNCGANLQTDDLKCPYCGTDMVRERSVTESDGVREVNYIGNQNVYYMENAAYAQNPANNDRKADIVSKADPKMSGTGAGTAFFIGGLFMVLWTCFALGMGIASIGDVGLMALVPFGMAGFGVVMLVLMIRSQTVYLNLRNSAPRYEATVLGHSKNTDVSYDSDSDRRNVSTVCSVKVLAMIDGRETCIVIKSGHSDAELLYPVGSRITIAGRDNFFIIIE